MTTYNETLGIEFIAYEEDYAKIRMPLKAEMNNAIMTMHGGLTATLADTASGYLASGGKYITPTNNMTIYYFSPVKVVEGEYVYAEARLVKRGKKIIIVECDIIDYKQTLCARATVSFSVIEIEDYHDTIQGIRDDILNKLRQNKSDEL